ncbi:MAG: efflux RND transporter periplasmic adaptor subunit [Pseudomonadota bacterium]
MKAALILAIALTAAPAGAGYEPLIFEGRVEAALQGELASRLDGVVAEILFSAGDAVEPGQPMLRLDPADAELALAVADAQLALARAELEGAAAEAARQEQLFTRGISPDAVVVPARTAKAAAEAALALAEAERAQALLALERTTIRAPISGVAGPPATAIGAYLEAEAGPPLARIVALDPVIIAYRVPYATRLASMAESGAPRLEDLFARIEIEILLPGGQIYPEIARPDHASALVDPADGSVTVRAIVSNPSLVLRPGMAVTIRSTILPEGAP